MWRLHHNYPLKFVPYVHLSFLIFVSSELMSTVGSQIVAHTLMETGNGPNKPNTINL